MNVLRNSQKLSNQRGVGFGEAPLRVLSAETPWKTRCEDVGSISRSPIDFTIGTVIGRSLVCTPSEGLLCAWEMTRDVCFACDNNFRNAHRKFLLCSETFHSSQLPRTPSPAALHSLGGLLPALCRTGDPRCLAWVAPLCPLLCHNLAHGSLGLECLLSPTLLNPSLPQGLTHIPCLFREASTSSEHPDYL